VDKNCEGGASLDESIRLTLASYRTIPHPALEWKKPAEVLHDRQRRGLLSPLQPSNHKYAKHDKQQTTQFTIDSLVYARNYSAGPKWIPGTIISKQGNTICTWFKQTAATGRGMLISFKFACCLQI